MTVRAVAYLEAIKRERRMLVVVVLVITAITAPVVFVGVLDQSRQGDFNARICASANQTRAAVSGSFELMRAIVEKNPAHTPEERAQSKRFFDGVAAQLRPIEC